MPSSCRHERVEAQSLAVEKFEISEGFVAKAAMSAALCEIDLSPGSCSRPLIECADLNLIFCDAFEVFSLCPLDDIHAPVWYK